MQGCVSVLRQLGQLANAEGAPPRAGLFPEKAQWNVKAVLMLIKMRDKGLVCRQQVWTQRPQCKLQSVSAVKKSLEGGSDDAQAVAVTPEVDRARRRRLWYLAIKPPMYSVCIVPVLVSS